MLTFTGQKDLYADFTKDASSENKTFGGTLINQHTKRIVNGRPYNFTEKLDESKTTSADTQFYKLPADYHKLLMKPYVTIGDIRYVMEEIPTRAEWDRLNSTTYTSDIPTHFFIFAGQIGFYPIPSTAGNTISLPYRALQKTMTFEDHTTGDITDATNGNTTITGSGTSWNSSMEGKYLRITAGSSDPTGDGLWYKIASVNSATELDLEKEYEGETFTGGSLSYIIGEISLIPDGYSMTPIYWAVHDYFISRGEQGEADRYGNQAERLELALERDQSNKTSNVAIERDDDIVLDNPNRYPRSVG